MNPEVRAAMVAQIEARAALNGLPEDAKAEKRTECQKALEAADNALKKLLEATPEPAPRELAQRVELRNYLSRFAEGKAVEGAEAELNQGLKLNGETHVPLAALDPGPEARADAEPPTGTSAPDTQYTTGAIVRRVFARTNVGFLGVPSPSVGLGVALYPILASTATAAMKAANAGQDAGAYTLSTKLIKPSRATARFLFNMENDALIGPQLEAALRDDLRGQIGALRDAQILGGNGTAPNLNGVVTQLTAATAATAAATAESFRDIVLDSLDNVFVQSEGDVRVLLRLQSYRAGRKLYMDTTKTIDAIQALRNLGASVASTTLLAAESGEAKNDMAVSTGNPAGAVAPVWNALTVIRDPYTNASKAQTALTVHALFGFDFLRTDGWKMHSLQVR